MSYDLSLCDPVTRGVIHFDHSHEMRGGTYALGGTTEAALNITYNYASHYRRVFGSEEGIRSLYDKTGAESIPVLRAAIDKLGNDVSDNYWEPTEGNAKLALLQLLAMAQMRPDGVWEGD